MKKLAKKVVYKAIDIWGGIRNLPANLKTAKKRRSPHRFNPEALVAATDFLHRYKNGFEKPGAKGAVPVVIKADDLRSTNFAEFLNLLDYLSGYRIPFSMGLIAKEIRYFNQYQIEFLQKLYPEFVEIWVHGYNHRRGKGWREFRNTSLDYQVKNLEKAMALFQKIRISPIVFGAPFNAVDEQTVTALERFREIKGIFYGPIVPGKYCFPRNVEIENPPEHVVSPKDFLKSLDGYLNSKDPLIFQVHPAAWQRGDWKNFKVIIESMVSSGNYSFLTPSRFLSRNFN
ncbi:MAG: hypothetical protein Kow0037_12700 [Calditrichia bacterium]